MRIFLSSEFPRERLQNPFYEMDMPIRIRLFDYSVDKYARDNGLSAATR
jgi:hypothetical protein